MNIFNTFAPFYDKFMVAFGFYRYRLIIDKLNLNETDKVLDVGGGTGYIAKKISEIANDITVVDISSQMLKQAQNRGLTTICASALDLPFPENSIDVITCIDALHHIKNHQKTISEFQRVLKPNGKILIFDFHQKTLFGKLVKHFELLLIDKSEFISPENLENLMAEHRFEGKSQVYSRFEYYYLGKNIR